MAEPPKNPAAPKLTLSLYPELLQAERATISAAPVRYNPQQQKSDDEAKELQKKKKDASLQFQPIKRPQQQQKKKPQPKPGFPLSSSHKSSSSVNTTSASSPPKGVLNSTPSVQRSTFDDWVAAAEDDDEFYYHDRSRAQRGGKNRKKKNKGPEVRTWDWDDIYDPSRPNVFIDYKGSEEQHREVKDWKARLYHHQLKEARKAKSGHNHEQSNGSRPMNRKLPISVERVPPDSGAEMFAPPSQQMSFAPPTFDDPPPQTSMDEDDDYYPTLANERRDSNSRDLPVPASAATIPSDVSGEDAYFRRMRLSDAVPNRSPPVSSPPKAPPEPSLLPNTSSSAIVPAPNVKSQEALKAEALAKIAAFKAKYSKPLANADAQPAATAPAPTMEANAPVSSKPAQVQVPPPPPPPLPPQEPGVVVSRAPVRYPTYVNEDGREDLDMMEEVVHSDGTTSLIDVDPLERGFHAIGPHTDMKQTRSNTETAQTNAHQSNRPSKKGFAERLLKKYGWEKGQGLGAQGEGITTALIGKVDKRKKRSDADGGGWAAPANMGKIIGGKRRKIDDDANIDQQASNLSSVIKLNGMLKGLDVQREIEDNNLMQEIGDEMGSNYGTVERVFIWREEQGGANEVFVKFTSQLSAMRAKDAMDGTTFADNEVQAAFWDEDKFERAEYET